MTIIMPRQHHNTDAWPNNERPLVAIHGALSDHRIYAPMANVLGRYRQVITYDQAYFGETDWPDQGQGFSRRLHEDGLVALIEELECGPVDLFAWSYGGDVAMHAILRRPDLFHAVVFFDPSVGSVLRQNPEAQAAKAQFRDALQPPMQHLAAGDDQAAALAFFAGVTGLRPSEIEGFGASVAAILSDNARTLSPFLKALTGGNGKGFDTKALDNLSMPALFVTGEHSLLRYKLIAEWLYQNWPDAERMVLQGATHFGPWEKANGLAHVVEQFLTRKSSIRRKGALVA